MLNNVEKMRLKQGTVGQEKKKWREWEMEEFRSHRSEKQ
jgi:hypothetical protein